MAKARRRVAASGKDVPRDPLHRRFTRTDAAVGACLVILTLLIYSQVVHFEFVNYDDPEQVAENSHVQSGLGVNNVVWAFSTHLAGNWIPLTWLSFMAESQLAGPSPAVRHATNAGLHAIGALLLFLVLRRMTGARWPSALVAFLFALHPLHVESVAWVSERKDVLNGCFWMLTIGAYVRYLERPSRARYAGVAVAFALGLMTKSMIVTLPIALLLLDVWPLRRFTFGQPLASARPLVVEKVPLMALAAVVAVATVIAQQQSTALASLDAIPFGTRLLNALVSAAAYLQMMFWPSGLAMFYPYPANAPVVPAAGAAVLLLAVSFAAWRLASRHPYLLVGWLWYLLTLAPVIGLVQVGAQSRADRYTYIPMIGISIALAWGLAELVAARPGLKTVVSAAAVACCAVCSVLTWRQVQVWQNSFTLAQHAIDVTPGNDVAHGNLGMALLDSGRPEDALPEFEEAVRLRPTNAEALSNVGNVLLALGRPQDALVPLGRALQLQPHFPDAMLNTAATFARLGRNDEAVGMYQELIRQDPGNAGAHSGLGVELARRGRNDEAIAELSEATRLQPANADAHFNLGALLARLGKHEDAERHLRRVVELKPNDAQAHTKLGAALLSLGRIANAIDEFTTALRLDPSSAEAREGLQYANRIKGGL